MTPARNSNPQNQNNLAPHNKPQGKTTVTASLYQGAIPPPDMMEHYKEIDPSFPSRILAMAEDEGLHRRRYNDKLLSRSVLLDILGSSFGLIAVLAISLLSYFFMINGYAADGRTIAVVIMVALAGVFVYKKTTKKQ